MYFLFADVCRKVLRENMESDEAFWECFREAMRKLAARCRRVRHAKKVRSPKMPEMGNSGLELLQKNLVVNALNLEMFTKTEPMDIDCHQTITISPEPHTPSSSPSHNSSSTPTPSSSSKPEN